MVRIKNGVIMQKISFKKYLTLITVGIALQTHTGFAFDFPFSISQDPSTQHKKPISPNEIARFEKTVDIINRYYIKKVDDTVLFNNAISGMITRLDPHSDFLNQQALDD